MNVYTNATDTRICAFNREQRLGPERRVEKRASLEKVASPPHVSSEAAPDSLETLWGQDALGVVLAGVQVLSAEVQLLFAQFTCEHEKQC